MCERQTKWLEPNMASDDAHEAVPYHQNGPCSDTPPRPLRLSAWRPISEPSVSCLSKAQGKHLPSRHFSHGSIRLALLACLQMGGPRKDILTLYTHLSRRNARPASPPRVCARPTQRSYTHYSALPVTTGPRERCPTKARTSYRGSWG